MRANFVANFWNFCKFWLQFSNTVASPGDENGQSIPSASENAISSPKKRWKWHQNSLINRDTIAVQNYVPTNEPRRYTGAWQSDKNKQTPYFHTYLRRALFDLPKLCTVVENVEAILKHGNLFSIQHIVFLQGAKCYFRPLSKSTTGRLLLRGILPVNNDERHYVQIYVWIFKHGVVMEMCSRWTESHRIADFLTVVRTTTDISR